MKQEIKPGDEVEVNTPVMYTLNGPTYRWLKGYVFVYSNGKVAQVKHTEGMFKDITINVDDCNVRLPSDNG